ncbi:MAG: hypothetical protein QOF05_1483 [Sphingomonadales bacterium]|jgi:hypothetical protein|nr:hypothetical protein [Sphingomonadales bacterium]
MTVRNIAALALLVASSAGAQGLDTATPIPGSWTYAPTSDGSEAVFTNAAGSPQLWAHCTRATRRVTLARPAAAAAPFLNVWTSSLTRSVGSAFNPATGRLTIDLANYDPLLDAIVSSRGRVGFTVATQPPLVVPPWAEFARVIEDCRV